MRVASQVLPALALPLISVAHAAPIESRLYMRIDSCYSRCCILAEDKFPLEGDDSYWECIPYVTEEARFRRDGSSGGGPPIDGWVNATIATNPTSPGLAFVTLLTGDTIPFGQFHGQVSVRSSTGINLPPPNDCTPADDGSPRSEHNNAQSYTSLRNRIYLNDLEFTTMNGSPITEPITVSLPILIRSRLSAIQSCDFQDTGFGFTVTAVQNGTSQTVFDGWIQDNFRAPSDCSDHDHQYSCADHMHTAGGDLSHLPAVPTPNHDVLTEVQFVVQPPGIISQFRVEVNLSGDALATAFAEATISFGGQSDAAASKFDGVFSLPSGITVTSADISTPVSPRIVNNGIQIYGCSQSDLVEPFGLLDLADVTTFIEAFLNQSPLADLDNSGLNDLADIVLFVEAFQAGCP